tara:strand:- start:2421 stop:2876 length:456 start_codon:yes stop_codon:yes gene_type:complete
MQYKANTPDEYIAQLPPDRQIVVGKLRAAILKNLPKGFEEQISYGMLGYVVPLTVYPKGYHCTPELPLPFMNLASQKNFVAVYHSGIYADPKCHDWFVKAYPKHCDQKLDMGKSCIRFKKMEDVPYRLIGELASKITAREWITLYEKTLKR